MGSLGEVVKKHQNGAILNILVNTGAKKTIFPAGYDKWRKRIKIDITAQPKDNMANFEVIKTISKFFNISVQKVWIISGKTSKTKTILLKKISVNAAIKKLEESMNGL